MVLKAKLLGWKELAPEVHHFDFEVPGRQELHFTPGQFVSLLERWTARRSRAPIRSLRRVEAIISPSA